MKPQGIGPGPEQGKRVKSTETSKVATGESSKRTTGTQEIQQGLAPIEERNIRSESKNKTADDLEKKLQKAVSSENNENTITEVLECLSTLAGMEAQGTIPEAGYGELFLNYLRNLLSQIAAIIEVTGYEFSARLYYGSSKGVAAVAHLLEREFQEGSADKLKEYVLHLCELANKASNPMLRDETDLSYKLFGFTKEDYNKIVDLLLNDKIFKHSDQDIKKNAYYSLCELAKNPEVDFERRKTIKEILLTDSLASRNVSDSSLEVLCYFAADAIIFGRDEEYNEIKEKIIDKISNKIVRKKALETVFNRLNLFRRDIKVSNEEQRRIETKRKEVREAHDSITI